MRRSALLALIVLLLSSPAFSDGGMWTFQEFPHALLQRTHGADVSSAWLERVRTATIRLSNCTASFVSPEGLILTNHHCAEACLDENSTKDKNLVSEGFLARTREQELKCATQIADVLMDMEDITAKVAAATGGPGGQGGQRQAQGHDDAAGAGVRAGERQRQGRPVQVRNRRHCTRAASTGCTSTTATPTCAWCLHPSARSPPSAVTRTTSSSRAGAWTCRCCAPTGRTASRPRRRTSSRFRPAGPEVNELVFVSGHPGNTSRLLTVARTGIPAQRQLPALAAAQLRAARPPDPVSARPAPRLRAVVEDPLNGLENSIKVRRKQLDALLDERLMQQKREEEAALRAKVAADPALAETIGDPVGDHRHGAAAPGGALPAVRVPRARRRPGFNSRAPLWLRAHAGARRGRAPQAQHAAPARVQRQRPAARAAAAHGAGAGLPGAGEAHSLVSTSSACASGSGRTHRSCASCCRRSPPTRSPPSWSTAPSSPIRQVRKAPVGGRRGGRRCLAGSDDRVRAQRGSAGTRRAQELRGRGRGAGRCRFGKYRARPLQGIRHQRAAGCQLHAAPELRHRAGLERARTAGGALHAPVAPVRARHRQGALQDPGLAG